MQQVKALEVVRGWLLSRSRQSFYLAGYAGTGKTTLARHLAEESGGQVLFAAFTGKAAHVMRRKGCSGATTIHRLIYKPRDKSREALEVMKTELEKELGRPDPDMRRVKTLERKVAEEQSKLKRPSFVLNEESEVRSASLVVIDEVSMVGDQVGEDLESFGVPLLVLGDPAQLPPVMGGGYFTARDPDFLLTDVHRQAEGSPVLALAERVRSGGRLELGEYGSSSVRSRGSLGIPDVLSHDQVIVGTNKTRRRVNQKIRHALGRGGLLPEAGDRLVCLRNDHDVGVLNGGQWVVVESTEMESGRLVLRIKDEDQEIEVEAHRNYFEGTEDELDPHEVREAQCFDYGYALTCHKAQGSQWDSVLVIDEGHVFRSEEHRWRYTALTRAADRVTVLV